MTHSPNRFHTLYDWYGRMLRAQSLLPMTPEAEILSGIMVDVSTSHDMMMFAIKDAERLIEESKGEKL